MQPKKQLDNDKKPIKLPEISNPKIKEIALAIVQSRSIREYGLNDLELKLPDLIYKTHLNCGIQWQRESILSTINELAQGIIVRAGGMTFTELEISFANGWKGDYGDFFGLNNKTYFGWITGYLDSEQKKTAQKLILQAKDESNKPVTTGPTEQQQDEIIKKGCVRAFEDFKATGNLIDAGSVKYNFLERNNFLKLTPERKKQIKDLVVEKEKMNIQKNRKETENLSDLINSFMGNNNRIVSLCKLEALKQFFKELIETGIELKDFINQ